MEKQDMLNNDLLVAVVNHDKERAELMISLGADVNTSTVPDAPGYTPLFGAIDNDDIEMVQFLLRNGADAHLKVFIGGVYMTAFKYARGLGKQDIADFLEYA